MSPWQALVVLALLLIIAALLVLQLNSMTVLLSPVFGRVSPLQLAQWLLDSALQVRMQLQLHKYIWDPQARGV